MNKKILVSLLALVVAAPLYLAMADNTSTIGDPTGATIAPTSDCGSMPTAPAAEATVQERQQYRQQLQQYYQCERSKLKAGSQNLQDQKQQFTQQRCDLINQRINDRLSNFQSKQGGDKTIFGNVYQRLTNLATRLKSDNLDTTTLTNDLAALKTKVDKVQTEYSSFIDGLKATTSFTCGQSQGQFMGKLGAARTILLSVRQDRLDVKNYVLNTIKPDILALRAQLAKQEQSDKSTTSSGSPTTTTPTPNSIQ